MSPAAAARWTEPRRDDDARLVSDLISGDEDAFLRLVHREHASMIRYARLFVSTPASAEEVVQEAWVGMPAPTEDSEEDATDPDRFFRPGSPQTGRWMQPPEPWPDYCLERAETVQLVREAIERLPGLRRQVILLRDVEGWSAEEVCALLGITEGNQRVLLHRARSLIRVELERHFRDCNVRAPAPTPWRDLGLSGHGSFQ